MDRICRVLWPYLWCGGLLCVLSALSNCDAQAATRKYVPMPSGQSVVNSPGGPATRAGNNLSIPGQVLEGEFIPSSYGTSRGTKLPVKPSYDYSIPRTLTHIKNGMRGGIIGVGVAVGLGYLLDQIDAIIGPDGGYLKEKPVEVPTTSLFWCGGTASTPCLSPRHKTPEQYFDTVWVNGSVEYFNRRVTVNGDLATAVVDARRVSDGYVWLNHSTASSRRFGQCNAPSVYSPDFKTCVESQLSPLDDSDYDLMFDIANQQNAEWLKDLLRDACNGSNNPGGCFDELMERSALTGPSQVNGPSTTKTINGVNSSGVSAQTVVTTNTKYNITYGDNYYDYRKTTTTKTSTDGVPQSETTEEESEEVEEEQQEEQQEEPALCSGQGCDGPAYEDQYQPTEVTKEEAIDSYLDRISSIPIIAAVSGIFSVSVDGSCPVWEVNTSLAILAAVMPINLRFDYLCLSWVIALKPWIQAVMFAVCAMLAVRIALL